MRHKNDYSCIVFFELGSPKKWTYVHKLKGFIDFLNQKHKGWKYCNVYDRRKGEYLKRFYPGSPIPSFLVLLLVAGIGAGMQPLNSTFNETFNRSHHQPSINQHLKSTFNKNLQ